MQTEVLSTTTLFFAGLALVFVLVTLTWLLGKRISNYSIIDAIWSLSFSLQALLFYFLSEGESLKKLIALVVLALWSLRLGLYLTKRIASHHPHVDSRYEQLQKEYGSNFHFRFYLFYLMQAASVSLLTAPFIFVFQNKDKVSSFEWAGLVLWAVALAGESLADYQMNEFKKNSANKGKTCNVGLWKYSRHPNYFFESLIWWSFYFLFLGAGAWWGIYAPLIILHLLLNVTGVPPSEAQALKNRGDDYRRYLEKTSKFVPWFPKE